MRYRIIFNDHTTKTVGQSYGEKIMAGKLNGVKSFKVGGTVYDMFEVKKIEPIEEGPVFAQIAAPEERPVSREVKAKIDARMKLKYGTKN